MAAVIQQVGIREICLRAAGSEVRSFVPVPTPADLERQRRATQLAEALATVLGWEVQPDGPVYVEGGMRFRVTLTNAGPVLTVVFCCPRCGQWGRAFDLPRGLVPQQARIALGDQIRRIDAAPGCWHCRPNGSAA